MSGNIFSYPVLIKEIYLDSFGHMNNVTYLILFEEARWELITRNHYGVDKINETGLGPVVLEAYVRYMKEIKLRDEIIIETEFISYQKKIAKLAQRMVRQGEVCCAAEFSFGLFDLKNRKLVAPTEAWMNALKT